MHSGIEAALAAGIPRIKLNCVLMRRINEREIWPLIHFAAERELPIRFIELMPVSRTDVLTEENFLSVQEVMSIGWQNGTNFSRWNLRVSVTDLLATTGWHKAGATVGFIGAMTTSDFCAGCNKIRLTADGRIRPCLGRHSELDLLGTLRRGEGGVEQLLREAIAAKPEGSRVRRLLSARAAHDGDWRISGWGSFASFFLRPPVRPRDATKPRWLVRRKALAKRSFGRVSWRSYPPLASLRGSVRVARNCEYLAAGEHFRPGDEAALIPPVSGG